MALRAQRPRRDRRTRSDRSPTRSGPRPGRPDPHRARQGRGAGRPARRRVDLLIPRPGCGARNPAIARGAAPVAGGRPGPTSPRSRWTRSPRTRASRGWCSRRTRWPSWSTRCARSACCSPWSSGRWAADRLRADHGGAALAGRPGGRLRRDPGHRPGHRRRRLLRDALLENLHRAQLNPLEEAAAYDQLLQDFGCTHDELAGRIGRSRPQISNTLRLLKLPPPVQRRVAAGVLSAGHARALLGLDDATGQERLAQRIVAEGLSVRVGRGDRGARRGAGRRRSGRPAGSGRWHRS